MSSWPTRDLDLKVAAQLKLAFAENRLNAPPFITISREYGCDGNAIAEALVERLNHDDQDHPWHISDKKSLVRDGEGVTSLTKEMLDLLDEYGHSEFQGYLQHAIFGKEPQYRSLRAMAQVIRTIARRGHVVIVGRGAAVLTKDMPNGYHFRLYAPFDWRARNYAGRWKMSVEAARKKVRDDQGHRNAFLKTYLNESIDSPELYHMMFNNGRLSVTDAADHIIAVMKGNKA